MNYCILLLLLLSQTELYCYCMMPIVQFTISTLVYVICSLY